MGGGWSDGWRHDHFYGRPCSAPQALLTDTRLTPASKVMAVLLSGWRKPTQTTFWVANSTLATQLDVSERRVKTMIKELEDTGWIMVERLGDPVCHTASGRRITLLWLTEGFRGCGEREVVLGKSNQ